MSNNKTNHSWLGWLSWGYMALCVIVLGRNFLANDGFDLATISTLEWILVGVGAIGEFILGILKNIRKNKDNY